VAAEGAVRMERFELPIVLETILQLEDLNGEAQELLAVRKRGGLDVCCAPGDLGFVGVALGQFEVNEGVIVHADEASALPFEALDLSLGLANLAGVVLAEWLRFHALLLNSRVPRDASTDLLSQTSQCALTTWSRDTYDVQGAAASRSGGEAHGVLEEEVNA
jgi:hypothetical protein